jgi:membrane protein CcdC involved in cytochrome C biogenesis
VQPALLAVGSIAGAAAVFTWRLRETSRPIDARKIVIPPLGMSTGFSMFVYAPTRIPVAWGVLAFLAGALLFCYPLVKTSKLRREGDAIMLKRSPAFLWILVGLVAIRFAARTYVEQLLSPMQTGAIFFCLAFGMILPWRALMYLDYRRILQEAQETRRAHASVGGSPSRAG